MQRRRVLQAIVAGTTLAVAGCSDGANSDNASRSPTTEDNGGETGNDSNESSTTDETTSTPTEEGNGESDAPTLESLEVAFVDNYRFSVSVPEMGEPITGALNGGDFYSVVSVDGDTVTTYVIGGRNYVVADGSCTQVPGSSGAMGGVDVDSLADADTIEQDVTGSEAASTVPSDTATIDGEQMYVYELEADDTTATYYIGVESKRLRRVETQGTVFNYSDWGTVEPITAPC